MRSLHAQASVGLQHSGSSVDRENLDGSNRVDKDCDFVVTKRNYIYRQPLKSE